METQECKTKRAVKFCFKLYPSKEKQTALESIKYHCTNVRLWAAKRIREAHEAGQKMPTMPELSREITQKLKEGDFGGGKIPRTMLTQVLRRVYADYKAFFQACKKSKSSGEKITARPPRYRKHSTSFCVPFQWEHGCRFIIVDGVAKYFHMANIGRIRILPNVAEEEIGKPCYGFLVFDVDGVYLRVVSELGFDTVEITDRAEAVGIDDGLQYAIATSDGDLIEAPKPYRKLEARLKELQQQYSLYQRHIRSRGKIKTLNKIRRVHVRIKRCRKAFWREVSTKLCRKYKVVILEKRDSSKFLTENELKSIRKSAHDVALGGFREAIEWAAQKYGSQLVFVDPAGTSQECSQCGTVVAKDLSERWHSCPVCGLSISRDVNAAKNILKRFYRQQ